MKDSEESTPGVFWTLTGQLGVRRCTALFFFMSALSSYPMRGPLESKVPLFIAVKFASRILAFGDDVA